MRMRELQCGVLGHERRLVPQLVGAPPIVLIEESDEFRPGDRNSHVSRCVNAVIPWHSNAPAAMPLSDLCGIIRRRVIDHENLTGEKTLSSNGSNRLFEEGGTIEGGNDHSDI